MPDQNILNALRRIENTLSQDRPRISYKDAILATLYRKQFTLADAKKMIKMNMVMFDLNASKQTLAIQNHLKIYDIDLLIDDATVRYVLKNIDSDEPMSMLNEEIKKLVLDSRLLVREVEKAYKRAEKPNLAASILTLFAKADQKRALDLYFGSYWCYKFFFSVDLEFTRKDGTDFIFKAEFAAEPNEISVGLSKRPFLKDDSGMWYDMGTDAIQHFITTDVPAPLSVAYVRADGVITEIVDRKANDHMFYTNQVPSRYVLEVPQDWFKKNNIQEGDYAIQKDIINEENF